MIKTLYITYTRDIDTFMLEQHNGINSGNLVYHDKGEFVETSMIWFDDPFEHINIVSHWGPDKALKLFIVSGSSYEEAIRTQQEMRQRFGSSFVPRE
ncbi:hypothetical protein [Paenibacillus xylaniclasticus]|uniref:hypothetical protein n=1 Tax=Paenibacillus xylaniclasticus TaxID=588083 RepID=UPI000FD6BE8C|nr:MULTISPECIES: hypothetical protein [Paenibacillus]GFN30024.1 hypothetical protein PCURB6_02840 [Paenibacillus curdlanolyticus]